jgi:hypothetical protein
MQRQPTMTRSRQRTTAQRALDLPPDRAFVLRLEARAHLPHRVIGRVEHITSGRMTRVASVPELMAFFADVLRQPRGRKNRPRPARSEENG